jgi:four helix bundle protein
MKPEKDNIIIVKSFQFAVRIVKLYKYLNNNKKEFVLSKQLLRSGTSIGTNVREAHNGESSSDFIHKLGIAQKECDETIYWIELLKETDYLTESEFLSIQEDATELLKIIKSIILTMKQKLNKLSTKDKPN